MHTTEAFIGTCKHARPPVCEKLTQDEPARLFFERGWPLAGAQVDVPALRRMNHRHKPNLTRGNMKYFRPPSPTPEERRLLKKQQAQEKAAGADMAGGGKSGMSKEHQDKANKELDALFAE